MSNTQVLSDRTEFLHKTLQLLKDLVHFTRSQPIGSEKQSSTDAQNSTSDDIIEDLPRNVNSEFKQKLENFLQSVNSQSDSAPLSPKTDDIPVEHGYRPYWWQNSDDFNKQLSLVRDQAQKQLNCMMYNPPKKWKLRVREKPSKTAESLATLEKGSLVLKVDSDELHQQIKKMVSPSDEQPEIDLLDNHYWTCPNCNYPEVPLKQAQCTKCNVPPDALSKTIRQSLIDTVQNLPTDFGKDFQPNGGALSSSVSNRLIPKNGASRKKQRTVVTLSQKKGSKYWWISFFNRNG